VNAPSDDWIAANLLGRQLPDCALPATNGEPVNLRRLGGQSVVFIYPWTGKPGHPNPPGWDNIPGAHGSTPQAQAYARLHDAFAKLSIRIFGLSLQDGAWQSEFAQRMGLPFPLLSDVRREFSREMNLPMFETGGVDYLKRLTVIVLNRRIANVRYPVESPERDAEEILALVSSR
jgi:peroxiredoxin